MNVKEQSRQEYISRINKVMDYIENHIDEPLPLGSIASIANLSPYHFHRIFTLFTGETPSLFIQRTRIEKAACKIREHKDIPISEIAYSYGFSSVSLFSRTFRKYFNISATDFRNKEKKIIVIDGVYYSKDGKMISKNNQQPHHFDSQLCSVNLKQLVIMNTKIEIKEMPEMKVIYCRHKGAYKEISKAYEKLVKWAGPRGLLKFPETKSLTVYHDDPSITEIENVRQDACITVNEDVKVDGEIGKMTVDGGKYAVGHFEITETEFEQAWNTMCLWFTENGYQQGDGNTYELYYNDHNEHPEKKFILDICIPVRPL